MNQSLEKFLLNSSLAEQIRIEPKIIVQRTVIRPRDLLDIRKRQQYGPIPDKERICELEVGGQVLACGKIIRRRGEYFLKILEVSESEEEA